MRWRIAGSAFAEARIVAAIFGGRDAPLARVVYLLVGLSALWQIVPLIGAGKTDEARAQGHR